jgi:hypothetical protein
MLRRVTLVAMSLLVLAWLAVLMHDHRIVDDVSPRLIGESARLPAAEFRRDAERLEDARFLNPDPTWRLNLALALLGRDARRAAAEAGELVSREPDNLTAWKILEASASRFDRRQAARARARIRQLDPRGEP